MAIETSTSTAERSAEPSRAVVGHRFVVVSLLIAALLLIPGALGRLGVAVDPSSRHGVMLAEFWATLDDIRFGSGLRFWLGVFGGGAMALLLLYPLRKLIAGRRFLGSVAAWFKLHLLIGIFAPVAILYHTNFSLGGLNANVALWTMLAVAASGIIGQFVYARASAAYWGDKHAARSALDGAVARIASLGGAALPRERLAERLEAFDADQLTPRNGIRAAFAARRAVRGAKRRIIQDAVGIVDQAARETGLDARRHQQVRVEVAKLLHTYFAFAARAASRSVREQVWARWRMFHLPLFLVMCAATVLHVWAVWDMDEPASSPPQPPARTIQPARPQPGLAESAPQRAKAVAAADNTIQQIRRPSVAIAPTPQGQKVSDASATSPAAVAPAQPPQKASPPKVQPASPPATDVARATPTRPEPAVRAPAAATPPVAATPPPSPPPAVAVVPSPARPNDKQLYEELQKRTETEPQRMALGARRSLAEQIETYKAKMRTREFKHSDAETGFALTGKHTKADCEDCHKKPLQEARSDNPRQCIACHKKDDVHKGRRPVCADCHTTNSWREIRRKR